MTDPNFVLLYVSQPAVSAQFYSVLLGYEPIESSPTFAMFALSSGVMLGLWGKDGVLPSASLTGGGAEIAIAVKSNTEVDTLYQLWCSRSMVMIQTPCVLDFGYTFVAQDPDAHRIRVFSPSSIVAQSA
ncbi:drug:proton antiporter [Undibacterium sp. Dicai25W]|uniref:drug:proton antiporter n=1 Tax=Undibacterium sp. Dicai25W TaxID=3413034 RepID=UPI003BF011F5